MKEAPFTDPEQSPYMSEIHVLKDDPNLTVSLSVTCGDTSPDRGGKPGAAVILALRSGELAQSA